MPHSRSTPLRALQATAALLFIVSLGMGGKAYFQQFDMTAPAGNPAWPAVLYNALLFTVFALHHSVLARTPLKRWLHARVGPAVERSLYVIVASVLFLACTLAWAPVPGTVYALTGLWWWIGSAVQWAGIAVTLAAARTLNLKELMGLEAPPHVAAVHDQAPALETRGLYGLVRHPIYFGWVLFVAGAPLMTSTRLVFAVVSVTYLAIAIPLEERSLVATFGDAYRAYTRQVRWRMVPGVY
jgi:protein-S-isoprenylcysteine O-methyltransferase Ste14